MKDYGGEEERMTRRNISGPDLKPGHHIYTAHYAPQPTDTSCFINKKMEGSNDVCIILRVIWGFCSFSANTNSAAAAAAAVFPAF